MKNNKELLMEVLEESVPADFQATLFKATLRTARQRKRNRQWGGTLVAVSCAVVALFLLLSKAPSQRTVRGQAAVSLRQPLSIVHSQALAAEAIVRTRPIETARGDARPTNVSVISSGEFKGLVASGKATDLFTQVGDEELLALFGRPAVLIYHGPGQAELIALNPADMNGIYLQ